eukprot:14230275-Alexandrium_andersonii.AAC.1
MRKPARPKVANAVSCGAWPRGRSQPPPPHDPAQAREATGADGRPPLSCGHAISTGPSVRSRG